MHTYRYILHTSTHKHVYTPRHTYPHNARTPRLDMHPSTHQNDEGAVVVSDQGAVLRPARPELEEEAADVRGGLREPVCGLGVGEAGEGLV